MCRPLNFRLTLVASVLGLLLSAGTSLFAQSGDASQEAKGQADLDAATTLKLSATSMADLEKVIDLCESALEKGLPEESQVLAKTLVTATLFQHGSRFAQALFDPREQNRQPQMLKKFALTDLYKILKYDNNLPQVHMMIARLEAVAAGGARINEETFKKGLASADRAIELLAEDKETLSKALVLRAGYARTNKERMDFLNRAIEADATNTDAWRLRGKNRLVEGELLAAAGQLERAKAVREQAVEDFSRLLEDKPEDPDALQAVAELLSRLGDNEKAMEKANTAIDNNRRAPSLYILRGRIHHENRNYQEAIKDFNQAIDLQPDGYIAFLDRMESHFDSGDKEAAAKDYGLARELQQNVVAAVLQRATVRAQGNYEKRIEQLQRFIEIDEMNAATEDRKPDLDLQMQLALDYGTNRQPLESIEAYTRLLDHVGSPRTRVMREFRVRALELRANGYLGIGKHAEAIADYDQALKLSPKGDGVLNNLAWVLATSPNDELRDGERAIELATKACEVTQYAAPHIISTLAASYAETGNFQEAVKRSTEAVEKLAAQLKQKTEQNIPITPLDRETETQLKNELKSYEEQKPWRELQDVTKEGSQDATDSPEESSTAEASEDSEENEEAIAVGADS